MSVQANQYLIYGAKIPFSYYTEEMEAVLEQFQDSAFNQEMNINGLHCLVDGMSGEYIIIGRCLKKSAEGETISSTVIEPVSKEFEQLTREHVREKTGIDETMALHLITHYR